MGYWIALILLFIMFIITVFFAWYSKALDRDPGNFFLSTLCGCILGALFIVLALDIPSALSGGREIYVDGFPEIIQMKFVSFAKVDGELLLALESYKPEEGEQDAKYRVSYTRFTNSILDIEKVDE